MIRRLRVGLLPTETADLDLVDIVGDLESALGDRLSTLREAEAKPNATAASIVEHLLNELANIRRAGKDPPPPGGSDDAGVPPSEDAVVSAIQGAHSAAFRRVAQALARITPDTAEQQREAIAEGFDGGCVIAVRVLLSRANLGDPLAKRHPALSTLNTLRIHRLAYFNHLLRCASSLQPVPRMMSYEFAIVGDKTVAGGSQLLDALLQLDLTLADWIAAPHGAMGWWQRRRGQLHPVVHDKADYYCQPELIKDLCEFLHVLLQGIGVAGASSEGYTIVTAGEFFREHLLKAKNLSTVLEAGNWLSRAAKAWEYAMVLMGNRLRSIVYSPTFEQSLNTYVLEFDNDAFAPLKQAEGLSEQRANLLAEQQLLSGSTSAAGSSDNMYHLPLLSQLKRSGGGRQPDKRQPGGGRGKGAGKKPEKRPASELDTPLSLPPGSLTKSYKFLNANRLVISGFTWRLDFVATALNTTVEKQCWPYLLCRTTEVANRPARCAHWGSKGHESMQSPAHVIQKYGACLTVDQIEELAAQCARKATPAEVSGIVTKPNLGSGKGRGKGKGRGRSASRGGGGWCDDYDPFEQQDFR